MRGRSAAVWAVAAIFVGGVIPTVFAAGPSAAPPTADKTASEKPTVDKPTVDKLAVAAAHPPKAGIEFFEKKIRPVLVQHCYKCHSSAAESVKGGLKLDTREALLTGGESGAAIVPGDSQSSLLMEALRFEGLEMPPTGKLGDEVIADFATWIDMGAPDPRTGAGATKRLDVAAARQFWAYQLPKKPAVPTVQNSAWPTSDVDRFLLAALEKQGLTPAADADKITWLRRVTFDLIGLPPTVAEIDAFVADASPEAHAKVVDRLLASPQFGERWGRLWLDVARYGESTGKERNVPYTQAWRYRDWVVDAFNADKPYAQFVVEQIAGDLLPAASPAERNAQVIATGFLALGPKGLNDRNREQYLMDIVDEQIDVVTRAFLATTVGCARCHDHKFDPIPQTDYYAMAGIFRSTQTLSGVKGRAEGANRDYQGEFMPLAETAAGGARASATNSDPAARLSTDDRAKYEQFRRRLADRKAEMSRLEEQARTKGKKKGELNKQYKTLQSQVANLEAKMADLLQTTSNEAGGEAANFAMGVRDASAPADTALRVRGEPDNKGPIVPRGFVTVLKTSSTPKVNSQQSGRLQLAHWLASRDNPLTARVAVNRVWAHLFGRGLVETPDNFGALGEEPSHPELLDHLALQFMNGGWSTKKLIRELALSRAYRMSSDHDAADYAKDPDNRHLWRMNRRRLDAEQIRDALLAASGALDLTRPVGSPVARLSATGEIGRKVSLDPAFTAQSRHRSLYLPIVRNAMPEALTVFDAADPSMVVARREVTTVATQALFLMNNEFVIEQARSAAERLLASAPSSDELRVDYAYRAILSRAAAADERRRGAAFVREFVQASVDDPEIAPSRREHRAWQALCHSLMAGGEFRYLY